MNIGLQTRYTMVILGLVVVIVVILSAALFLKFRTLASDMQRSSRDAMSTALYQQVHKQGIGLARSLASNMANPLYQLDIQGLRDLAMSTREQPGVVYVYVYDDSGAVIHDGTENFVEAYGTYLDDPYTQQTLKAGKSSTTKDGSLLHAAVPIAIGSKILGGVHIGLSLEKITADIRDGSQALTDIIQQGVVTHVFATVIVALVLSLAGIAVSVLVARSLSRPIKVLSNQAHRIGRGDYAVDALIHRNDEIGELNASFTQMVQDLERTTVSKSYLDNVLQSMLDPLIVARPDGIIEAVNEATCRELGYDNDELIGSPLDKLFADTRVVLAGADTQQAGTDRQEGTLIARDGRQIPVLISRSVMHDARARDQTIGVVYVMRDISARKQAEDALRSAKEAAERANAAKSRFLAAASHDLRQPLQAISILTGLLLTRIEDPETGEIVDNQRKALNAISDLLDAFLDISKLEAGAVTPEMTHFAIEDLLGRIKINFQEQAQAAGLDFRVVPCSAAVRSDAARLERVLQNLVSNAIRYTDTGKILVGCRRRGSNLRIEVWDTGIGIPEDQRETIFEEFYQLDNPGRDRSKGLGLGLAIVDRIARLLGHAIDVRSTPGKGSMFAIEVPLATEAPRPREALAAESSEDTEPSTASILLIDDEPLVLEPTRHFLESRGFSVMTAMSGSEALQQLGQDTTPPDLIITDYRLPDGETGEQAIEAIRHASGRELPAIIITGDTALPLSIAETVDYRVLYKPIDVKELTASIHELLNYARTRAPAH